MLKIGLTGGIGSGKTVVSNSFEKMGVPVIDTDAIARELVIPNSVVLGEIVTAFGEDVLTSAGELDRKRLGYIVFSGTGNRKRLEAILHPRIRSVTLERVEKLDAPYCILVIPLLIETNFTDLVDKVLVVDAPDENRIKWVKKRSGLSNEDVQNIINTQANQEDRIAVADYVIVNDKSIEDLEAKTILLHSRIMAELE